MFDFCFAFFKQCQEAFFKSSQANQQETDFFNAAIQGNYSAVVKMFFENKEIIHSKINGENVLERMRKCRLGYVPRENINHPAVILFLLENGLKPLRRKADNYDSYVQSHCEPTEVACYLLLHEKNCRTAVFAPPEERLIRQYNDESVMIHRMERRQRSMLAAARVLISEYEQMYRQLRNETAAEQTRSHSNSSMRLPLP